jgi:membrane associated rhomboid family serine protease
MSHLISFQKSCTICLYPLRRKFQHGRQFLKARFAANPGFIRCASQSNRSPSSSQGLPPKQSTDRRKLEPYIRKRQVNPSNKALIFLNRLNKDKQKEASIASNVTPEKDAIPPPAVIVADSVPGGSISVAVEVDANEVAIQQRIAENRKKLLWPGVWTLMAVAGTCGTLAFLDAKYTSVTLLDKAQLPERVPISQSWFLTPTVIKEGVRAGWSELDNLTIGIVVASIGIHFLKKSPFPVWGRLIHVNGGRRYTAFTHTFVHSNWAHLGQNVFGLCWFLPGVVHYMNGDLFQAAALFASIPLITSYLQHFAFRWGSVKGFPLNMGSSGAIAAMLGAFCMAYPDEKVWTPNFLIFRLDTKYCGALFAMWQLASVIKTPKGGNLPVFVVSR